MTGVIRISQTDCRAIQQRVPAKCVNTHWWSDAMISTLLRKREHAVSDEEQRKLTMLLCENVRAFDQNALSSQITRNR